MRAVRLTAKGRPLEEARLPDREPGPGEVAIQIHACGICHSDAHYRAGFGNVAMPRTLGHEIAGVVEGTGERVAVHYLLADGRMIGKESEGGYADRIIVPRENLVPIPDEVSLEHAAVMMCSTATAYHALRLADLREGESVGILGFGGLGVSALQLAFALGAKRVFVKDNVAEKIALAKLFGGEEMTDEPFDVALDFIGNPALSANALRQLNHDGRLMIVALSESRIDFNPYRDLLAKERRIIGCSDHTRDELLELVRFVLLGRLDMSRAISATVPLDAAAINAVLDDLDRGTPRVRTVITPQAT